MVDYLDGAPGVHSHKWLGREATDLELCEAILKNLKACLWRNVVPGSAELLYFMTASIFLKKKITLREGPQSG